MELSDVVNLIDKFNLFEAYGRRDLIKQFIKDDFLFYGDKIEVLIYIAKVPLEDSWHWHKFVKSYVSTLINFS